MIRARRAGASAVLLVTLAGCSAAGADQAGPGDSSDGGQNGASAPAADAEPVTVTRPVYGVDVELTVAPIQVRDGVALLSVEYALDENQPDSQVSSISIGSLVDGAAPLDWSAGSWDARLVDLGSQKTYPIGTNSDGRGVGTEGLMDLEPGGSVTGQSMHAAPDPGSVDVLIPAFGYIEDVPVVDAGAGFEKAADKLGGVPTEAKSYDLRSFSAAYDNSAATKRQDGEVTVSLTSDVLFDSSSAELSGEATATLDRTAEEIRAESDGGTVRVVGHTDDVDSDAFNQRLSEQRAGAVASRLTKSLGSGYTVKAEGRGESEPVAQGTSDEARAANRRVDVVFEASKPAAGQESENSVPKTDLPTASGNEAVEYSDYGGGSTVRTSVQSVERREGALIGTLEIELVDGMGGPMAGLLGDPMGSAAAQRGSVNLGRDNFGVHQLMALTPDERVFPLDYAVPGDDGETRRVLGDEYMDMGTEPFPVAV